MHRALIVGIAGYENCPLPEAVLNDARDLATRLRTDPLFGDGGVALLENPGRKTFVAALAQQTELCGPDDTFVLFISSHGARIQGDGGDDEDYILPVDFDVDDIAATSLSGPFLRDQVEAVRAGRKLVILDCCHAAGVAFAHAARGIRYSRIAEGNYAVLASSSGDQQSHVLRNRDEAPTPHRNSLFTSCLLEALDCVKPDNHGALGIYSVATYVQLHAARRAKLHGLAQTPWFQVTAANSFPIATVSDWFENDVFLNCFEEDNEFVTEDLRPRLETRGVRVCRPNDDRYVLMPRLDAIRVCASQARYTLTLAPRVEPDGKPEQKDAVTALLAALQLGFVQNRGVHISLLRPKCHLPLYLEIYHPAKISDPHPTDPELDRIAKFVKKRHDA